MKTTILIMGLIILSGCIKSTWSKEDKGAFMIDCQNAGQSYDYCLCSLMCLENDFKSYFQAQKNPETSFNQSTINECVNSCLDK